MNTSEPASVQFQIRMMENRDVDAVLAIQSLCPEMAQWTLWDYNRVAAGDMAGWVAEERNNERNEVAGFLVARQIGDDIEVLNLAVAPDARRNRVGTILLSQAITWAVSLGAENVLLEVRESNHAALQFYERHGFGATGRRPRYYTAPVDDALLLTLTLAKKI